MAWLLLALLFLIPGIYLEYPADPWEHYARINEWASCHLVGDQIAWAKSAYFLAYSLVGHIQPPTRQLFWLNLYSSSCCVLLCWQYRRLAQATGLTERASFIFVITQALTLGNSAFGFYRYYSISSSLFAQLGAVALVRVAIEVAGLRFQAGRSISHLRCESPRETEPPLHPARELPGAQAPKLLNTDRKNLGRAVTTSWTLLGLFGVTGCLLAFIAFNHLQGIGIAGLGVLAVIIWRLIEWKRSMIGWMIALAVVFSLAAIRWWPRAPALDGAYRSAGWLTAWYGFNVFDPHSIAGGRTTLILGLFGIFNLVAGLFLLCRNQLIGWLTWVPLVALSLPVIAIPLANVLSRSADGESTILTFHRMLFAIPSGLAVVAGLPQIARFLWRPRTTGNRAFGSIPAVQGAPAASEGGTAVGANPNLSTLPPRAAHASGIPSCRILLNALRTPLAGSRSRRLRVGNPAPFLLMLVSLAALTIVPADGSSYNRIFSALMVPADDLAMGPALVIHEEKTFQDYRGASHVLTNPSVGFVLHATGITNVFYLERRTMLGADLPPPSARAETLLHYVRVGPLDNQITWLILVPQPVTLQSPYSLAAVLSGHWYPQELAMHQAGGPETGVAARQVGARFLGGTGTLFFLSNEMPAGSRLKQR